jgi:Mrp family chromosome partitioning ATPase
VIGTALAFGFAALGLSLLQRPVYEAITTLYITAGETGTSSTDERVEASQRRVATYAQLVYSGAVLTPATEAAGVDWSLEKARESVKVESKPELVTLTIYVSAPDPETAHRFASAIADNMARAVSTLEVTGSGFEPAAKLSVITPATVSSEPAYPTTALNVVLGGVIGLFVGAFVVLVREALNKKVRDARDAEVATGTRTLASFAGHGPNQDYLVDFDAPEPTELATSYRDLRSRLLLQIGDQTHPKVLLTSARSAEGTTTIAINLGAALAHAEKSAVVVNANFDDPQVVQRVGVSNGPGLTDVMSGGASVPDAVRRGGDVPTNMAVLGVGTKAASHPEGVFASAEFTNVLTQLAQQFDYVIIDAPPLLENSGTETLLSSVDGVVLVSRVNVSTITDLVECGTRVSDANARLLGIVLSGAKHKQSRHRKSNLMPSNRQIS